MRTGVALLVGLSALGVGVGYWCNPSFLAGVDVLRYVDVLSKIAVPIVIYLATKRLSQAQYFNTVMTAWNDFNKLVISSPQNMEVVREMNPPLFAKNGDEKAMRKAYIAFVYLNVLNGFYFGQRHGLLDRDTRNAQIVDLLEPLLRDEDIYAMTQGRGYHPKFRKLCAGVKRGIDLKKLGGGYPGPK